MQFLATIATIAFAVLGSVSALPSYTESGCSTGTVRCCNSVESATSPKSQMLLDMLNLDTVVPTESSIGMKCSSVNPTTVGGSTSCSASPVCCSGNSYGGISLGCAPINTLI